VTEKAAVKLFSQLYLQAGRVFPLMTSGIAEKAVADIIQPMTYLPATSPHPSCGLEAEAEPVSMTTSATVQNMNLMSQKDAKHEAHILTDIKVLL